MTVRFVVFSEADIHHGLKSLIKSVNIADIEPGNKAILSQTYPRAARVFFDEHYGDSPNRKLDDEQSLTPLMFNLTTMYYSREQLLTYLRDTGPFVKSSVNHQGFAAGTWGDVPDMVSSAPSGVWELTDIESGEPRSSLFHFFL